MRYKVFFTVLVLIFALPAFAGGPSYVDRVNNGRFFKWRNGQINIVFDNGSLTDDMTAEESKDLVKEAWKVWEDASIYKGTIDQGTVPVSNLKFIDDGDWGQDINETNYQQFYYNAEGADSPERPTIIIFDKDGKIFEDLVDQGQLPSGSADSILGLTQIYAMDKLNDKFINGTIILNGPRFAKDEQGSAVLKATLVHELGHLLGLDHSAVNDDTYDGSCSDGCIHLPTMYKFVVSPEQETLHFDDKTWVAFLYNMQNPDSNIMKDFCVLSGEIFDVKGRGFQGAEILVRETNDQRAFATMAVSGWMYDACATDDEENGRRPGMYILTGLRPGKTYSVTYGPLPNWCGGKSKGACGLGSGINPFAPPRALEEGGVTLPDGDSTFECVSGGDEIVARSVILTDDLDNAQYQNYIIDGRQLPCTPGEARIDPDVGGGTSPYGVSIDKKGWCSLVPGVSRGFGHVWFFVPALIILIFRFRKTTSRW